MTDKPKDDNQQVVADLQNILKPLDGALIPSAGKMAPININSIMQPLLIYVVRRTHLGWDLGYNRGLEDGKSIERGEIEPEEED